MMHQAPMLSAPLKQTNEIDWVSPLKSYIRDSYGDDPERYAEECGMLNRLRQDMRGAGKDSASGRDLLYRYYGQLELLDLRFPVDENHIKISFTWFDAFTLKPTSQYSLAYEKASIIFNISAVLSCHAAHQNRHEDNGLKTAYHSFQASAGMFTYINENFLHAPSSDLSRETIKTLIQLMLAQAQEVFLEKQIADQKKVGLLAKLASQASFLYGQALEGVQENVNKGIFERSWLMVAQIKNHHMSSVAQYYQALADNDANSHGIAICRLQVAEALGRESLRSSTSFPSSVPANSNLTSETGITFADITRRHLAQIQEKLAEFSKDNDFIFHQPVPAEASLSPIPKLPAAKAIPVSELYQGQDIQRIIGPDIFQRIVPLSVTESASLYDEEKAKLVRAEAERVEIANDEMAAGFDYLKLPQSLEVLKGVRDQDVVVDHDFRKWCEELAGHSSFTEAFEQLSKDKTSVAKMLDESTKNLDMEESVCEKMRIKYGDDWTQQPSSRLTATLRTDIRNYRIAMDDASTSDTQLYGTFRQFEGDFEEMRSAGETDEADILYQRAMIKAGASKGKGTSRDGKEVNLLDEDFDEEGLSVAEQIASIEELMRKLKLVKKEREQVLKDLKEKVHNDDISSVLILNKKSIANQDTAIFKTELAKFRPHQSRISQANHKQNSLLKDLTRTYDALLQDKRVRSEHTKLEALSRQKATVSQRYRKVYQAFRDLESGLISAQTFYDELRDSVSSLRSNVDTFVNNRRSEGGSLLSGIEKARREGGGVMGGLNAAGRHGSGTGLVDWERDRLKELMDRMSTDPSTSPRRSSPAQQIPPSFVGRGPASPPVSSGGGSYPHPNKPLPQPSPFQQQQTPGYSIPQYQPSGSSQLTPQPQQSMPQSATPSTFTYNPTTYGPVSPPLQHQFHQQQHQHQQTLSSGHNGFQQQPMQPQAFLPQQQRYSNASNTSGGATAATVAQLPPNWQPPPPPPGPPPSGMGGRDPYEGLSGWK